MEAVGAEAAWAPTYGLTLAHAHLTPAHARLSSILTRIGTNIQERAISTLRASSRTTAVEVFKTAMS